MLVNKISNISGMNFKGINYVKDAYGRTLANLSASFNPETETCQIVLRRTSLNNKYNLIVDESPFLTLTLTDEKGVNVDLEKYLGKEESFVLEIIRKNKETGEVVYKGPDTGSNVKKQGNEYVNRVHNEVHLFSKEGQNPYESFDDSISEYAYSYISRRGTTPLVYGAGYLVMPDNYKPGMKIRDFDDPNTGELYYDEEYQKRMEGVAPTFSIVYGGSIASMRAVIPYMKTNKQKVLFGTPFTNCDSVTSHSYLTENNNQMHPRMGNIEDYALYREELFQAGIVDVHDITLTAEGMKGIHFSHMLRWLGRVPDEQNQMLWLFKAYGAKDNPLGLGIIPENSENLRFKPINPKYIPDKLLEGKRVPNPDYDPNKAERIQFYDASQVTDAQKKDYKNEILRYENIENNGLNIITHNDTIIPYTITPLKGEGIERGIELIKMYNKKYGKNITLDSPEAASIIASFSNAKITKKTEGGYVTWDANPDLGKINYGISGYDEKYLKSIPNEAERTHIRKLIERGSYEAQSMAMQSVRYWTGKVKDIQTLYTAKTLGTADSADAVNKLIEDGKLPEEARLTDEIVNNIKNNNYLLKPKGLLKKDEITVKSLMRLPLDSLEFNPDIVGILSTSYFSPRATREEDIRKTRFELMQEKNPHLIEQYKKVYTRVEGLYNVEIKNFADSILKKVDEKSSEKLFDSNGNYTEYGEYIAELVGQDIAKYAFLKSIKGDSLKTKLLKDGKITYDYKDLRESTDLNALGLDRAHSPEDEALMLEHKLHQGLKKLSDKDISYVADAISQRIDNTNTLSFRLSEAIVEKAGLGARFRLDAVKDNMDTDSVRNKEISFDEYWNNLIKFCRKLVQSGKEEDEHSVFYAELTDVADVMRETTGKESTPYDSRTNIGGIFNGELDATSKFYNLTGITSEAAYPFTYTDTQINFAPSFDSAKEVCKTHDKFREKLELLFQTRNPEYVRNLYSFAGNQDKPRMIHGYSLDMELFYSPMFYEYSPGGKAEFDKFHNHRLDAIAVLSGATKQKDVPIELRLNVDNNEYFNNVSSRAVAMSKLLMGVADENLKNLPQEDIMLIKNAIVDLTNQNYLNDKQTAKMTHINVKALSSIEDALKEISNMSGITLSDSDIQAVVDKINTMDLDDYLVQGGFDWGGENTENDTKNNNRLIEIMGSASGAKSYSLYTIQLARLIRDGYKESHEGNLPAGFENGLRNFIQKYNQDFINNNSAPFIYHDDKRTADRKNGYGARDIRNAIELVLNQAEFKSGKHFSNREELVAKMFLFATEPGVKKAAMHMEFLGALPGNTTIFAGDEYGLSGYDEKTKNLYLQNRWVVPHSEVDDPNSKIGEIRRKYAKILNETMSNKTSPDLAPLREGTGYLLDVVVNEKSRAELRTQYYKLENELKKLDKKDPKRQEIMNEMKKLSMDIAKVAFMMYGNDGNATISIFNAGGINLGNRFNYFEEYGLDSQEAIDKFKAENNIDYINPDNPYIPIQPKSEMDALFLTALIGVPVGAIFKNANSKDDTEYVIKVINGKKALVRADGKKIVMDGKTSRNGVMVLKRILKNISHKGSPYRTFTSNPYKQKEIPQEGQKLSIIAG